MAVGEVRSAAVGAPSRLYTFARRALGALAALAALTGLAAGCDPASEGGPPVRPDETGMSATAPAPEERRVVLFLGDSLSAGYGVGAEASFPSRIQERIDAAGLPFRVVNAGVSGDTTAGGLRRLDWLLQQPVDTLVIQLGGNDMLRGLDLEAMRANLRAIAARTREAHPDAALVMAGMQAPPNLGADYVRGYRESFEALAEELGAAYVPFLLEGVAMRPGLNQADGIHPTAEGHEKIADNVWSVLAPVLRERG